MTDSPETFDIEAWLTDAHLPEESTDVYKGGHLVAELNAVKRRIEAAEVVEDAERTAGDKAEVRKLEAEYERLLTEFAKTKLTVYVSALSGEQLREMRAAHEERTKDLEPKEANVEFAFDLLAAAIVGVRANDGDRKDVSLSADHVKALAKSIGEPQLQLILQARQQAQNAVPVVDADFLLRRSGTSDDSPE